MDLRSQASVNAVSSNLLANRGDSTVFGCCAGWRMGHSGALNGLLDPGCRSGALLDPKYECGQSVGPSNVLGWPPWAKNLLGFPGAPFWLCVSYRTEFALFLGGGPIKHTSENSTADRKWWRIIGKAFGCLSNPCLRGFRVAQVRPATRDGQRKSVSTEVTVPAAMQKYGISHTGRYSNK